MRRRALVPLLFLCSAATLGAQDTAPATVLRTVFIGELRAPADLPADVRALVEGMPEMLATDISSRQPFTRVDDPQKARSTISFTAVSGSDGLTLGAHVAQAEGPADEIDRTFSAPDTAAFIAFITDAARRFAPELGPVPPEADVLKVTNQQELIVAARTTDYLDQLDKRTAFTLWGSGLLRLLDSTGVSGTSYYDIGITPLIVEGDWFFSRNLGVLASFDFSVNGSFDYGQHQRYAATGYFFLPGAGIIYRTLGQVSAEYAITLSAGFIYLVATGGDLTDMNGNVALAQGASTWSPLVVRLRIAPSLAWNVTPQLALKTTLGFDIIFPGAFPWYDSPLADFQFLGLGVAWRP